MKKLLFISFALLFSMTYRAQTNFTVSITNVSNTNSITCSTPSITLVASTNYTSGPLTFGWTNGTYSTTGGTVSITAPGIYTLVGFVSFTTYTTATISIGVNTVAPVANLTPSVTNINCTMTSIPGVTTTVISPTVNITQQITTPSGGNLLSNLSQLTYSPQAPGVYTNVITNLVNGCSVAKTFTVNSTVSYPSFSLPISGGFTLGCGTKSVATISFSNAQPSTSGATLTFSLLPLTTTNIAQSTFTTNVAGNYTAIIHESGSNCELKIPLACLSNTLGPVIDSVFIPNRILTCDSVSTIIKAVSSTPNISYLWTFNGSATVTTSSLIVTATLSAPSTTAIPSQTCVIIDNSNLCRSTTVVTIYQNLFAPTASISSQQAGINVLTCLNPSLVLNNASHSNIPPFFNPSNIVVASAWIGPSPQPSISFSSSYTAAVAGIYTLVAKDLSNGCISQGTKIVSDNRVYPQVTQTSNLYTISCPAGSVTIVPVISGSASNYSYTWLSQPNAIIIGGNNSSSLTTSSAGDYTLIVTDPISSCSVSLNYGVWACVGINSQLSALNSQLNLYPNPSNGIFSFDKNFNANNFKIIISNSLGQNINYKILDSNQFMINESSGIYYVSIYEDGVLVKTNKLIVH